MLASQKTVKLTTLSPFDPEKGPMYIRETIAIVDRLPITAQDRERIYWRNAAALLKLTATG